MRLRILNILLSRSLRRENGILEKLEFVETQKVGEKIVNIGLESKT